VNLGTRVRDGAPAFANQPSREATDSHVLHLGAVAGLIWLLFLISLTLGDYLTRGWVPLNH
jgi:hypothetical protein